MAEYEDIRVRLEIETDDKDLSKVINDTKKAKEEFEGLSKSAKKSSAEARSFADSMSKVEAFTYKLEGQTSKLAELLSNETLDKGAVGRTVLGIKNTLSQIEKLKEPPAVTERGIAEAISPAQAANMAKMASESDILATKIRNASERLAELYNTGASSPEITKAVENVRKLMNQFDALQESMKPKEVVAEEPGAINMISPEMAGHIAESASKLQLLEIQAESARRKLADLFMQGADDGKIARAAESYKNLLDKIDAINNPKIEETEVEIQKVGEKAEEATPKVSKFERIMSSLKDTAGGVASFFGRKAISNITGFAKAIGNVVGSFKRIMFYRAVRSVIREITQAFGEGTKNLYQWSKLLNGEVAQSMDKIATAGLYMKNSLGAMVSPLINYLAPAIDYLIDKFVALLNIINKVLAVLTGAGTWTKAIKFQTEYAKATGSAADAAHKLGLAGIDQLTILDKQRGNSGSGFSADDYAKMFETETLSGGIWDQIKDAIANGDWRGAGKILAEKLNEMVDGLNTFSWGNKVGEFLNKGLELAYGLMKFTNFVKIGEKISEFLNGMLDTVHWETMGRLWMRFKTALFDTLIGALETVEWKSVGRAINDFIIGALNEFEEWLDTVNLDKLGDSIVDGLIDLVEGLDLTEVASTFLRVLWKYIVKSWQAEFGLFAKVLEKCGIEIEETADKSGKRVSEITDKHWKDAEGKTNATLQRIQKDVKSNVDTTLQDTDTGLTNIEGRIARFGETAKTTTKTDTDQIKSRINTTWSSLEKDTDSTWGNLSGSIQKWGIKIGVNMSNLWGDIKNTFQTKWNELRNWWGNLSLPAFKVKMPHIFWSTQPAGGWVASILSALGLPTSIPKMNVEWYAKGGFPNTGDLFIANEAGAEMVGSMNGHTAVANQQEITAGIREGVYDAVMAAMSSGGFSANVYLDGKQISGSVVKNINSETRRTGTSPLLSY